jgi:hypothetical protein
VNFWQDNGTAFAVPQVNGQAQPTITATIPVRGSYTIETAGTATDTTEGWAEVLSSQSVGGTAIFASGGQEAAVPFLTSGGAKLLLPFDVGGGLALGVALANNSLTQDATVSFTVRDESNNTIVMQAVDAGGKPVAGTVSLPRHQHSVLLFGSPPTGVTGQRGVIEFDSPGVPIFVLGIRANNGAFTSMRALGQ